MPYADTAPKIGTILFLEDEPWQVESAKLLLEQGGFGFTWVETLELAFTQALHALHPAIPHPLPTLLLFDLKIPVPAHPELESVVLAATLNKRMQERAIKPAWIVGMTSDFTEERHQHALFAGCSEVFTKPLTARHVTRLQELIVQPPTRHLEQREGEHWFQIQAEHWVRYLARAQRPFQWTAQDAHLLLHAVTTYPPPTTINYERMSVLLLTLDGPQRARSLLSAMIPLLTVPQGRVLQAFLDGLVQRELSRTITDYNRTWIYRCVQQLPEVIATKMPIVLASVQESAPPHA